MIFIEDLTVSYGKQSVLQNCNLHIARGERAAFMGPSGCGKTTLLACIAGISAATSGTVFTKGEKISYVFQEPRLLPWLTAVQNLNVVLSDSPKTLPSAFDMLERLQLSGAAEKFPHELSGGMRQRLAIGRALLYDGDPLLLDEPLKGLDKQLKTEIAQLIKEFSEGKTILTVSHDESEVSLLADTVYMHTGKTFQKQK